MNDKLLTAKEYLSQAYRIDQRINAKLEQACHLRAKATNITVVLSDIPVDHTPDKHPMETTIVRIVDLEREINEDIDRLVDMKREMYEIIQEVKDPEYQLLLELRYLLFKPWKEVAAALERESRYIFKINSLALAEVEKIIFPPVVKDIV